MNKGDKEAASSRDAWGGSLPAEGAAQAGDSGRRWLSLDEDSSGPCGWNGGNEGESRNRPGSELSGARRGRAPLRSEWCLFPDALRNAWLADAVSCDRLSEVPTCLGCPVPW